MLYFGDNVSRGKRKWLPPIALNVEKKSRINDKLKNNEVA